MRGPRYCQCGCGKLASNHPHPFGITQEHIRWCRHLKELGILNERHYACARLPLIDIGTNGTVMISVLKPSPEVPEEHPVRT